MRLCSPSPPATAPCVHGIGTVAGTVTGSGFGTATGTGTGHGPFIRALLSTMSADTQRLNEKRACCHRRNVDFALGLPRLRYKYTWIYIPVHECAALPVCMCVCVWHSHISQHFSGTQYNSLPLLRLHALPAAPPARELREKKDYKRMQYTLWNCQMDGWMDGIHKKECVGVLIFTCCATVTACLPRPPSCLPRKREEREEKGSEPRLGIDVRMMTAQGCAAYVRKAIAVDSLEPGESAAAAAAGAALASFAVVVFNLCGAEARRKGKWECRM